MRITDERMTAEWADLDTAVAVFAQERRRLFGIAYRMTGSVADAEDVLQEAWIRWQHTDRSVVKEPGALLTTVVTRLCINEMQSLCPSGDLHRSLAA